MNPQSIVILDFGSQYVQLIARRVRENHVHSVIVPPDTSPQEIRRHNPVGLILSGGPASVYADHAPRCHPSVLEMNLPVLGICYGMQLVCEMLGGKVEPTRTREFGRARLTITAVHPLVAHIPETTTVWMSHGDVVQRAGDDFRPLGTTETCPIAVVEHVRRKIYGVQFHPEVTHTACGNQLIRNFLYDICGCTGDWNVGHVVERLTTAIQTQVRGRGRVLCALSGGVDSSVAAVLIHRAVGERLTCVYVDNGLMRQGETDLITAAFREYQGLDLRVVDASRQFLTALEGVTEPQQKRRIIGHQFIEVFKHEAGRFDDAKFLAQGTLYPDVIESGHSVGGKAAGIKLHHNVGGLPAELGFELVEPLRDLFKDEVRRVGEFLGLPREIVWRHPFPGPGLAVRIIGEITPARLDLLRAADAIVREEMRTSGWHDRISQGFCVLLPVSTVGVMGDDRSYAGQHVIAVRFVETADFMTADWVRVDYELLAQISTRIMNEVHGVNRVVYDVSSKPPATIEWE